MDPGSFVSNFRDLKSQANNFVQQLDQLTSSKKMLTILFNNYHFNSQLFFKVYLLKENLPWGDPSEKMANYFVIQFFFLFLLKNLESQRKNSYNFSTIRKLVFLGEKEVQT